MNALLVHNPAAGPRDVTADLQHAMSVLRWRGWHVECRRTTGPGDATHIARQGVAEGFDLVVAVGGDGTIGEVVSGLAGSECVFGVLPVGTGNVWARNLGVPLWTPTSRAALVEAARILAEGCIHRIDLGRMGDRHFLLHMGVGFDAQVAQEVEPYRVATHRNLRNLGYYAMIVSMGFSMRGTRMTISIDGQVLRQRVLMVLVSNAQFYAGSVRVAPAARLDDGMLDVYVFKGGNTLDAFRHIAMVLLGKHLGDPRIEFYQAREISVRSDRLLPVQLDGEPVGSTPVSARVSPLALRVVVPQWASESLFRSSAHETWPTPAGRSRSAYA